jgi:hypothetical protein
MILSKKLIAVWSVLVFFSCTDTFAQVLESGFVNPPDSIQTSIYWYWISDQISEEGVIKDLQSMKAAGINRAFIGNIGLKQGVGKVKFGTEEWWSVLHTALKTATELGIDIGIFNSPGWSQSGGPWVKPEQAMRYLASTSTLISGGHKTNILLEKPVGDFEDVKVIAYPLIEEKKIRLTSSTPKISSEKEIILDFTAIEPFTLRSLKIYASQSINNPAKIQVKENGEYKTLAEFQIDRYNAALRVGFDPYAPIVVSVAAVTAQNFRLVISNMDSINWLKDVELSSVPAIERYPEKTLTKMHQSSLLHGNEYQWREQPVVDNQTLVVDPAKVIDISEHLSGDRLVWDTPEGDWVILRTGMLPTGITNAPVNPEARGLETDKMSKKHIEAHFDAYMGEILKRIPIEDRKSWKVVVADSYEVGGQNFTDDFLAAFKTRYKYNPLPYLPAYFGTVVQSEEASNRFLWDLRRLIADKIAYDYVGGLRDVSHKHGLTTWLENYGHWGFPGEFLQYGGQSDEIGGEFWTVGEGDIENRAASSSAHIYGKTKVSSESFTSRGPAFSRYPAMLKQRGDRFFSEGINNSVLHVYISQPYEDKEYGVNAWFGVEFNRKNTWFPHFDLFITYLKRVNFMLQQGLNVADVAYFIGEDAPKMTGITNPELPKGYQFDFINAEVIEKYLTVKNGLLTLPHGTQYKILVLPPLETMRPELLRKIKQLIEDGAVVLGSSPKRSPSLENYPETDKQVQVLAASLWSNIRQGEKQAKIGKGLLIDGMDMQEALNTVQYAPDCRIAMEYPVLYGHRNKGNTDIYFLTNQSENDIAFFPEFRVKGKQPELWNPVSGKIRKLPAFSQTATGTVVPIKLAPNESAFIVFRSKARSGNSGNVAVNYPTPKLLVELSNSWKVTFDKEKRGPEAPITMNQLKDLSTFEDFNIKHYSGTIIYENSFHLDKTPHGALYLTLTDLSAMAKIKINGEYAGGIWTPPYSLDISAYTKKGDNTVSIEVTTTLANRLIGDQHSESPLQKSGLTGPVKLEVRN